MKTASHFLNLRFSLVLLLSASLLGMACKTAKKVSNIQEALSKKDTTQTVMVVPKVDSNAIVRNIMERVAKNKIDFKTFNAKIKIDYQSVEDNDTYTGYLSMLRDSLIYLRIRGSFLGISAEGMQVRISKDSVVLVKKVGEKYIQRRTIAYLQEVTKIPFDFYTLQDLLMGNPVFLDSNIVSYREGQDALLVLMVGNIFKHLITLTNDAFLISHSKLDDVDLVRNRTCDITFDAYKPMGPYQFSTLRRIAVAERQKLDINLEFKEFALNEALKYGFDLPRNYKSK